MTKDPTIDNVCIIIYISPSALKSNSLNEVLWGIEEEGIPYCIKESSDALAQVQSHQASIDSVLGVGIGFGTDDRITVHSSRLEKDHPLLKVRRDEPLYNLRNIGANAARLVKGIPFKL
ncbi:glycerol dehydratase reactivase beta/small subunit family protein [Alkalibacterium kapii]|uniref:Glycerol dehydratase n=1 Tax=Alkalibacterium kapii TaxID=426704 RepID=A0A511AXM8_9LACT|nr:glycerol dehydratase reactivase beta/small subunit family protein [Alkalibacterium kapii]GEK91891.1 glycerol dehydratase [Alkalibacterium kapii]